MTNSAVSGYNNTGNSTFYTGKHIMFQVPKIGSVIGRLGTFCVLIIKAVT